MTYNLLLNPINEKDFQFGVQLDVKIDAKMDI